MPPTDFLKRVAEDDAEIFQLQQSQLVSRPLPTDPMDRSMVVRKQEERMERLRKLLSQLPEDESEYAFCMRVASGDVRLADRFYNDVAYSEVWRSYLHMVLYQKQLEMK